jgi:hypothetical protein
MVGHLYERVSQEQYKSSNVLNLVYLIVDGVDMVPEPVDHESLEEGAQEPDDQAQNQSPAHKSCNRAKVRTLNTQIVNFYSFSF